MMKFTLIYLIFFVLAFQTAFSATEKDLKEALVAIRIESENQSRLEENTFLPFISGEMASGRALILISSPVKQCFFYNYNSKDLQISNFCLILKSKTVSSNDMNIGTGDYSISNIPIYLQTSNFRL